MKKNLIMARITMPNKCHKDTCFTDRTIYACLELTGNPSPANKAAAMVVNNRPDMYLPWELVDTIDGYAKERLGHTSEFGFNQILNPFETGLSVYETEQNIKRFGLINYLCEVVKTYNCEYNVITLRAAQEFERSGAPQSCLGYIGESAINALIEADATFHLYTFPPFQDGSRATRHFMRFGGVYAEFTMDEDGYYGEVAPTKRMERKLEKFHADHYM